MALTDVMNELEKAVSYAKELEAKLATANAAQTKAATDYNNQAAKVESLRAKLSETLDDVMGNPRIRKAG